MLVLNNVGLQDGRIGSIYIKDGAIVQVGQGGAPANAAIISFEDCCAFPGLINSHDHLDFNLFPQLGNRIYNNYLEWGTDIHREHKEIIQNVLRVPKELRAKWGMYKNLIAGVTTVVQHGEKLITGNNIISVINNHVSLHSVRLEKYWKVRLNRPFRANELFVIHTGEGTDEARHKEIDELIRWNVFNRKLIGIHAVSMDEKQAKHFEAIVWCPGSNFFMLNKTARIATLKNLVKILFGTDATVSSDWNIWHHLRMARATGMLGDHELYNSVNADAAGVWRLYKTGRLHEGYDADIIITKKKGKHRTDYDHFFSVNPEDIQLVLHKGNIVMFDAPLMQQLKNISLTGYACYYINGSKKYAKGDLPLLIKKVKKYMPEIKLPIEVE